MPEPGDGNFKWFWCLGTDLELCHGPFDTREEVLQVALADGDGRTVSICEADKRNLFFDCISTATVLENLETTNEEAWGEDGMEIVPEPTAEQENELEQMLGQVIAAWFARHKLTPATWSFGTVRVHEIIPPPIADSVPEAT